MKKIYRTILIFLAVVICAVNILCVFPRNVVAQDLSDEQRNAIAMLNYITVLTQDINASKNSRLYMEEAYSSLINNTYPNAVDSRTLSQLTGLLDTMERYRMLAVKRERLQYIYEQNQAQAIRFAIPNPIGLLSAVQSFSIAKLVSSVVFMAVDATSSYASAKTEAELKYLEDGWALDDEEANVLHESRKSAFSYMVKMVNEYSLPGELTLTESTVDEFVKWKNNSNVTSRIQFLEANKQTYQSYGGYWLALAESYYENGDFDKCLDAVGTYEDMTSRIFRRDYQYANILPLAIASAKEVYKSEEYAVYAEDRVHKIISNTDNSDWALRYFAAQTLIDVSSVTENSDYLKEAYDIVLNIVNTLVPEQQSLNKTYLEKVIEVPVEKGTDKETKKQIQNYNKMLNEARKTELPPVYEPLKLSCDLLFALAEEIEISASEQAKIDRLLHPDGDALFLSLPLDNLYKFDNIAADDRPEIQFGGNVIIIPASYLTEDTNIRVTVSEPTFSVAFTDWTLDQVKRDTEGDISSFKAAFSSQEAKSFGWAPDQRIVIKITSEDKNVPEYSYVYQTTGTKNNWYDYLKVWEGHKNNWYDYVKVWENSVTFELVK